MVLDPVGSRFDKNHVVWFVQLELLENNCLEFVARKVMLG